MVGGAFDYLENRFTNNCNVPLHCQEMLQVYKVIRIFDPRFALVHLDEDYVDSFDVVTPIKYHVDFKALKGEVDAFKRSAAVAVVDDSDFKAYTESVLKFWRVNGHKMPTWSKAARIAFSIPASSCAAERVFALLRCMFGKQSGKALADLIETSLRLRYNDRVCV